MKLNELKLEVDYFEFDEKYYHKVNPTPLKNPKLVSFNPLACDLINLDYLECETSDFVDFIKIVDQLNYIDAQSTALICTDVPEEIADRYRLFLILQTCFNF